jgi:cytoskeletal protein RodZ
MNQEIRQIGILLKAKRKELNLSLKEVENSTSIRSNYIDAIEDGRIGQVVAGVYAVGFIKQYATFLGLDTERMVRENPEAFQVPAEKHEFSYGIGTLEMRGSMGGGVKWLPNLMWAGLSIVLIAIAWWVAKYLGVF